MLGPLGACLVAMNRFSLGTSLSTLSSTWAVASPAVYSADAFAF
jgi:hypothetical protein